MAGGDDVLVTIDGKLKTHMLRQVQAAGRFKTASDYIRDLIQRDLDSHQEIRDWYEQHLKPGIEADQSEYISVNADDVIRRNMLRR